MFKEVLCGLYLKKSCVASNTKQYADKNTLLAPFLKPFITFGLGESKEGLLRDYTC